MLNEIIKEFKNKLGEDILIRFPNENDVKDLHRFINEIAQEDTYINIAEEITMKEEEEFVASVLKDIEAKENVTLVAVNSVGKIVGFSDVRINKENKSRSRHIGIFGIILDKNYRGTGLGKELMTTILEESIERIKGLRSIILHYFANNEVAKNMYEKFGFEEVGRIKEGIFRKDEFTDEVIMQLDLNKFRNG